MSNLPIGWCSASLGELCSRIVDGSHNPPKAAASGYGMLSARNVQARRILFDNFRWISESDFNVEDARTQIAPGDVLLTIVGTIGRTAVVPIDVPKFALQRSVAVLKAHQTTDPSYLAYVLESSDIQRYFNENAKGTAQKGIYLRALGDVEVPLAPRPEQKRIADKLDSLLARVDACRDRLDRVPDILKRFRQSVLAAATSGELTREWREANNRRQDDWPLIELRDVCHSIADGDHQAPPKADAGIPFITISAINTGVLRLNHATRFVPEAYFRSLRPERRAQSGDVLLSVTGSIGIAALVDTDAPFVFQRHIAVLRPNLAKVTSEFLCQRLSAVDMKQQGEDVATGTAQLTIPLGGLRAFTFALPPLDEQREISRRLGALFTFVTNLESRCQSGARFVAALTPSALTKAFRGELVPQDSNDEPASELLERIRASRKSTPKKQREVRKRQSSVAKR